MYTTTLWSHAWHRRPYSSIHYCASSSVCIYYIRIRAEINIGIRCWVFRKPSRLEHERNTYQYDTIDGRANTRIRVNILYILLCTYVYVYIHTHTHTRDTITVPKSQSQTTVDITISTVYCRKSLNISISIRYDRTK